MAVQGLSKNDSAACSWSSRTSGHSVKADAGVARGNADSPSAYLPGLVRAVEGEIVPRLLLARRSVAPTSALANDKPIAAGDAHELARLLLTHDVDVPLAYVESIRYRGVEVRDIYIRLLAPAARRLGEMWEQDECDFLQVTVGLGRLQQVLHEVNLSAAAPEGLDPRGHTRRALLATTPGDTHSFGIMMVSQFFRRAGWEVFNEFPGSEDDLAKRVREESFDLVGLSAGCEARIDALIAAVRAVRRCSRNHSIGIIVGGPLLRAHPELAARVGADATAEDGEQAARLAESVFAALAV